MYTIDTPKAITNPASDRQVNFIRALVCQKYTPAEQVKYVEFLDSAVISKFRASEIITHLKSLPDVNGGAGTFVEDELVPLEFYMVDGVVYRVKLSSKERLYAEALEGTSFNYAPGAIRNIRAHHKLTLAQAKAYGAENGVCCRCGATLTNPDSIEAGIGPICAGKF